MKGLIISLAALVFYALSTMLAAHVLRPQRHLKLFVFAMPVGVMTYLLLYRFTPDDLYFLPRTWLCSNWRVDLLYGLVVFLFNCHSLVCALFGISGGFSVSLLAAIRQVGPQSLSTGELVARFRTADGSDRIYGWRVPHLVQRGYLRQDTESGNYALTAKGRVIAVAAFYLKRMMNLRSGG
jgi:hypothetical protein